MNGYYLTERQQQIIAENGGGGGGGVHHNGKSTKNGSATRNSRKGKRSNLKSNSRIPVYNNNTSSNIANEVFIEAPNEELAVAEQQLQAKYTDKWKFQQVIQKFNSS